VKEVWKKKLKESEQFYGGRRNNSWKTSVLPGHIITATTANI
jgi:hypothetical protein